MDATQTHQALQQAKQQLRSHFQRLGFTPTAITLLVQNHRQVATALLTYEQEMTAIAEQFGRQSMAKQEACIASQGLEAH